MGRKKGARGARSRASRDLSSDSEEPEEDVWAQCENPACQKWRRLPPGTLIDEKAPWFCNLNPDPARNTCQAPEETYIEEKPKKAVAVAAHDAYARGAPASGRYGRRGSGRRGGGRGRRGGSASRVGSDSTTGGHIKYRSLTDPSAPSTEVAGSSAKRKAQASSLAVKPGKRQKRSDQPRSNSYFASADQEIAALREAFGRILKNAGAWQTTVATDPKALFDLPTWVWNGLTFYAPDCCEAASQAVELVTSAAYFSGQTSQEHHRQSRVLARLALLSAASTALNALQTKHGAATALPKVAVGGSTSNTGILKLPSQVQQPSSAGQPARVKFAEQLEIVYPSRSPPAVTPGASQHRATSGHVGTAAASPAVPTADHDVAKQPGNCSSRQAHDTTSPVLKPAGQQQSNTPQQSEAARVVAQAVSDSSAMPPPGGLRSLVGASTASAANFTTVSPAVLAAALQQGLPSNITRWPSNAVNKQGDLMVGSSSLLIAALKNGHAIAHAADGPPQPQDRHNQQQNLVASQLSARNSAANQQTESLQQYPRGSSPPPHLRDASRSHLVGSHSTQQQGSPSHQPHGSSPQHHTSHDTGSPARQPPDSKLQYPRGASPPQQSMSTLDQARGSPLRQTHSSPVHRLQGQSPDRHQSSPSHGARGEAPAVFLNLGGNPPQLLGSSLPVRGGSPSHQDQLLLAQQFNELAKWMRSDAPVPFGGTASPSRQHHVERHPAEHRSSPSREQHGARVTVDGHPDGAPRNGQHVLQLRPLSKLGPQLGDQQQQQGVKTGNGYHPPAAVAASAQHMRHAPGEEPLAGSLAAAQVESGLQILNSLRRWGDVHGQEGSSQTQRPPQQQPD